MTPRDVQTARLSEKLRRELGPVVLKALSEPRRDRDHSKSGWSDLG